MHIKFVHTEAESLGIEHLSAVLKRSGHTADLAFDFYYAFGFGSGILAKLAGHKRQMLKAILCDKPDLVAFSVASNNSEWAYGIAEEIKRNSSVPIVFGGIQPTLIPEKVIAKKYIDFVIAGEGEYALLDLAESLSAGRSYQSIKNLYFKNNGEIIKNPLREPIGDLDELPFPDKELAPGLNKVRKAYSIITGRGCFGSCTYCCSPFLKKIYGGGSKFIRRRSPQNVIAELEFAKKKYGIKTVIFEDDLFTYDKNWLRSFSEIYEKKVCLPCILCTHPNYIDEEMVLLLKRIKCRTVEIGVQSLNETTRRETLKRYYSNERLEKALRLLKAHDICCQVDNIIGLPGENETDVLAMVKFYNEIRPGKIDIFYLKYYPGTEIMNASSLAPAVRDSINNGETFSSFVIKNTENMGERYLRQANKIALVASLIYVLPKRAVNFIIRKRIFRFFPSIKNLYNLNAILFFISSFFTKRRGGAATSFRGVFLNYGKFLFYNLTTRRDVKA